MECKQVGLLLTVVMLFLAFDCGNCNTQENRKVVSIRSNAANGIEHSMSALHHDSRSVHRFRRSLLTSQEEQEAIDTHHRLRRLEGASDMEIMTYSDNLATTAENWAFRCRADHEPGLDEKNLGQNIYYSTATSINMTAAIQDWYNEKPYYNYTTLGCQEGKHCAYYTQVVWATSREVGCAYSYCAELANTNLKNATILVCNYRPNGNVEGQKPFQMGTRCSQCPSGSLWCNEGLCNRCARVCLNSGSVNNATCSCSCASGWTGVDCSICARVCLNSGSVNNATCSCSCAPGWSGVDCSVVGDNNYSTSTNPSLLNMLSVWLSWLLINIFWSI